MGRVEWTPRGASDVVSREYRFLSPVFDYDSISMRIVCLVSAGLTAWKRYSIELNRIEQQEDFPLNFTWPDAPS
jgi:hypothetical protein